MVRSNELEDNSSNIKRDLDLSALVFLLAFFFFGWLGDRGYYLLNQYINTDGILIIFGKLEITWGQNFIDGFKYVGGPLIGAVILFGLQKKKFLNFDKLELFQKILIIMFIVIVVVMQISFISYNESLIGK